MKKRIVFKVIGRVLGILLIIAAIFLAVTSLTFSYGESSSAPSLFGFNVYLVKGGDFYQLKDGTAALAQFVWPDEVQAGDIIIYNRAENGDPALALVNTATLKEAVMRFDIETEDGEKSAISQGQYVAKVTHCSDFWGAVVRFAVSPYGLLTVAVLPCLAILAFELVKFIFSKLPTPQLETVKIQQDNPTFIPKSEREKIAEKRVEKKEENKKAAEEKKILKSKPSEVSSASAFTERLKTRQGLQSTQEVKDRADFSAAAQERMKREREKEQNDTQADSAVKTESKTENRAAPTLTLKPEKNAGEPDISLVFKEDDDKRFDIDDILATIETKGK